MKILVKPYSFDKATRRISFTSYASIALENVLLITNVKDNAIIYNFADSTLGGSLASNNILQLDYDTSSMGNTDPLQIFYDDGANTVPINDNGSSLTVDNNGTFAVQASQSGIWQSLATVLNFPATTAVTQTTSPWVTAGNSTVFPGATFPVSDNGGSLTVDNGGTFAVQAAQSGNWAVSSLATVLNFPTNQNVNLQDGSGNDISSTGGALDVNLSSSDITLDTAITSAPTISIQGTVTALITSTPTTPIMGTITANAGTNLNTSALALESGGNLDSIAASLDTLDGTVSSGKIQVDVISAPTISVQGTVSTSVVSAPTLFAVVNTSAQGVTNSLATILNFPATQAVSGTITANQGTSPWVTSGTATVTQSGVVHVDDNASSLTVDNGGTFAVQASQTGVWSSLATILNFPATQNVAVTSSPTIFAVVNTSEAGITNSLATILNFPATQSVTQGTSPWVVSGTATVVPGAAFPVTDNASSLTVDNGGTFAVQVTSAPTTNIQGAVSASITSAPTLFAVVNTGSLTISSGATVNVMNFPATTDVTQSTSPWVTSGTATVVLNSTPTTILGTIALRSDYGVGGDDISNSSPHLQDAFGNALYPRIWNHVFDGTGWDRMKGDSTDGVLVNLGTNNDVIVTSAPTTPVAVVSAPTLFAVVNTSAAGVTNSLATVLNFPATQNVALTGNATVTLVSTPTLFAVVNTGSVDITSGATVNVLNFPATQAVTQSGVWQSLATVLNFPSTYAVTQTTSPWVVSGNATVFAGDAFPVTDNGGALTVDNGGTFAVQVTSAPTISVQGTVSTNMVSAPTLFAVVNTSAAGVTNSLATILNFPATQAVTQSGTWEVGSLATVVSVTPGTGPTNLGKVVGSNATSIDVGVLSITKITDSPGSGTVEGNYMPLTSSTNGRLWVDVGGDVVVSTIENPVTVSTHAVTQSGVWTSLATILNFPATQTIDGNATVFAGAAFPVTDNSSSLTVDNGGTFPVQATQSGTWTVSSLATVLNFPSSQNVVVTSAPTTPVMGTVTADTELPAAAAQADNLSDPTTTGINVYPAYRDGSDGNWDRARALSANLNTTAAGSGIAPAGMTAQFDDASTTTITENNWGNLRISTNRNLYNTIRDAAGNERGANVDSSNRLSVSVDGVVADFGRTLQSAGGAVSASGDNIIINPGAGKQKIYAFSISTLSTTAITAIFKGGSTELWRAVLQAPTNVSTGANLAVTPPGYLFAAASGASVYLNLSGAATINWSASYFTEA